MIRKILFGILLSLATSTSAFAQNTTCSDRPASDVSNACANTRFVKNATSTIPTPPYPPSDITVPDGQLIIGNGSGVGQARALSGDCTIVDTGVITCSGGGSAKVVNSYATLRIGTPTSALTSVYVEGRTTTNQNGQGWFTLIPSDTTSADNDGTILVDAAGNRWHRQFNGGINVGWFNLLTSNTATANDAAISNALAALGANLSGTLIFPPGSYQYTTLIADNALGLIITSEAGTGRAGAFVNGTNLICTVSCIKLRGSFDSEIQNIELTATVAAAGQYLIDLEHAPSASVDTRGFVADNVLFDGLNSSNGTAYTVNGINFLQVSGGVVSNSTFLRLASAVRGQNNGAPSTTNYSNNVTFDNDNFSAIMGYPIINPGQNWTINGGYTQVFGAGSGFLTDGAGRVAVADPTTIWQNLVFINHSIYDVTVGGTNFIDLGPGTGLKVIKGLWGGIATSNLFIARGVVSNVEISAQASNFNAIAFANVSGQLNWSFHGLNMCSDAAGTTGCSTNLIGVASGSPRSNITVLNTDDVTPYSGQGVFSTNGFHVNPDGTIDQWGLATGLATGANTITLTTPFSSACYNVVGVLSAPGATTNTVSLSSCGTTTFSAVASGTGPSNLLWRAIGK